MSAIPNLTLDTPAVTSNEFPSDSPASTFRPDDAPIENLRPLRVIVIGAGYSGIYCGIRIPEKLRNVELVIYEKNAGVGGTWYENRYLGCACDVPSHSYQYSFEPNPNWSALYAPASEIRAYLEGVAKKYSADRFIKLSHQVTSCRWDDAAAKWHVTVKDLDTGEVFEDTANVLISARGNLNTPAWPDIEGLQAFKGEVMHSAKWNESYDFTNKRIGVVGTGSSAIQIVPSLQRLPGTKVTVFARSRTWISPPFSQPLWDKHGFEGFAIPDVVRQRFNSDPAFYDAFRLAVEEDGNAIHSVTIKGTPLQLGAKEEFKKHMQQRLASAPHIFEALLPSFSPGCRRLTPGPGYLEALTQPNITFTTSPISSVSPEAVHTADGTSHDLDALVCATGFHAGCAPPFPILGDSGMPLEQKWSKRPTTYLSHSIASFPNFFLMLGPNAAIGAGSLTTMIESVGDYIVKAIRKLQKENIEKMVVKRAREEDFLERVDAYFKGTVFGEDCKSWYKNGVRGMDGEVVVTGLWPGSTLHCIECMRSPRWEDYLYRYVGEEVGDEERGDIEQNEEDEEHAPPQKKRKVGNKRGVNRLTWLGNGWSVNQIEERDLAWYLYPEFLDLPVAPLPEQRRKEKIRPFSY